MAHRGMVTMGRLFLALGIVVSSPLLAQETDGWQWRAGLYAWLPDIEGTTRLPTGADGPTLNVDAKQLLDNLSFTFMAALKGRNGSWGVAADLIYLDESGSRSGVRDFSIGPGQVPGNVELDARLDLTAWVWSMAGTYRLRDNDKAPVDLLLGFRMLDIEQTLSWSLSGEIGDIDLPGRSGANRISETNWDAIVGAGGEWVFGSDDRWFIPWHVDMGTGNSDFTWQGAAGLGYRFDWGTLALNYRYLDYDLGSGQGLNDLTLSGPLAAVAFRW